MNKHVKALAELVGEALAEQWLKEQAAIKATRKSKIVGRSKHKSGKVRKEKSPDNTAVKSK